MSRLHTIVDRADIAVLESEILTAMQLMGVRSLKELRPEMVQCLRDFW